MRVNSPRLTCRGELKWLVFVRPFRKNHHREHREPQRAMAKKPVNPRTFTNRSDPHRSSKPVSVGGLVTDSSNAASRGERRAKRDAASIHWLHPLWASAALCGENKNVRLTDGESNRAGQRRSAHRAPDSKTEYAIWPALTPALRHAATGVLRTFTWDEGPPSGRGEPRAGVVGLCGSVANHACLLEAVSYSPRHAGGSRVD